MFYDTIATTDRTRVINVIVASKSFPLCTIIKESIQVQKWLVANDIQFVLHFKNGFTFCRRETLLLRHMRSAPYKYVLFRTTIQIITTILVS